jgi:hypothetical protein
MSDLLQSLADELQAFYSVDPFSLGSDEQSVLTLPRYRRLTEFHRDNCPEYGSILDKLRVPVEAISSCLDVPFLPVRLFKDYELRSLPHEAIVKTMTSSGTTGQQVSKIYLDKQTALSQTRVLANLVGSVLSKKRLPLLIIDSRAVVKNRQLFSARGAGILGFSIFGTDVEYALDDQMRLDVPRVRAFISRHQNEEILLFGFTSIIWEHFYQPLSSSGAMLDLRNGVVVHGGGWKKLINQNITNDKFKKSLRSVCGVDRVLNYYGMVEQTGSIYLECEQGFLHSSIYSEVTFRRPIDFSECELGEPGLIEVMSVIPMSYPGHALLTEDMGVLHGRDNCICGRRGAFFHVLGRAPKSEVRGCSDTYVSAI